MRTFEQFLQDKHAEDYKGMKDKMTDDFNSWIANMDINECIELAEEWGDEIKTLIN